ncbi:uncharacterized protein EI90DRAFT_3157113 [Cantharellus anzutake]|uniref:uncharacterized protein n=1 Tax=Cantharellus anzutake TaxID=1750568 RepID=UPI00190320D2|nr:uncharacterized protein EI90DRAFT_3157113 [Cantharellus anzutake]KAF8325049.1 hypothetical protein EI90DRAFT_3157113 [Cantharellus anzutake]
MLEAAKEKEHHTHTIPFYSEGVQFVRITTLGNDDILSVDPESHTGETAYRAQADAIGVQCRDILGYRWNYHGTKRRSGKKEETPALLFRYRCAQDQYLQRSRKIADHAKHQDRRTHAFFGCESHLDITLQVIQGLLTARIDLKHTDDHIPYRATHLPPKALELITLNKDKPLKDLWLDVRREYPTLPFSRDAVYNFWRSLKMKDWKLDDDPVISAKKLLEKASIDNGWEDLPRRVHIIELGESEDYESLGFSITPVLELWRGRIKELVIDSAWKCATGNWELFVLLGEARGSGLPLGWCFVRTKSKQPKAGSKEAVLTTWLRHFRDDWNINALVTHSDKDRSEKVFPTAKHQLCFWHVLRAVKQRLAVLRRQPAPYNAAQAATEFAFINPIFIPIHQREKLPEKVRKDADIPVIRTHIPRVSFKLGGQLIQPRLEASTHLAVRVGSSEVEEVPEGHDDDDNNADSIPSDVRDLITKVLNWNVGNNREGQEGCVDDGDATDEADEEDAPDWMFEANETRSADPEYEFCPAVHRKQILLILTRHFCRHPFFPTRNGIHQSDCEIRDNSVQEMYTFCIKRGLADVWGYLWTSWYSPLAWKLWARSSNPSILSRLRTTMTAEKHWQYLKHTHLGFMHRPRLDQTIYTMITGVIPSIIDKSIELDGTRRLGLAPPLTTFQTQAKKAWRLLAKRPCSGIDYSTDAIQARGPLPPDFFETLSRRRTMPIYKIAHIRGMSDIDNGSISDGNDSWLTVHKNLSRGAWRQHVTGGPTGMTAESSKRCHSSCEAEEIPRKKPKGYLRDSSSSGDTVGYGSDSDESIEGKEKVRVFMNNLDRLLQILAKQSGFNNPKWDKAIAATPLFTTAGNIIEDYIKIVEHHEARPEKT